MKPPTMPSVSKLSSRVICILGQNPGPFTLQGTNTYIIGTGPKRILVDTGEGKAEYIKLLQETLRQESVAGISEVVLTHHHRDHVGGVRDVLSVFGDIPVWKSTPVENKLKRMRDVEGATSHEIPDAPPYRHFEDGHVFSVEGATLEAISTPGHTNDHMALKLKEENAILSGMFEQGSSLMVSKPMNMEMKRCFRGSLATTTTTTTTTTTSSITTTTVTNYYYLPH
eukprot:Rmarinus@m.8925